MKNKRLMLLVMATVMFACSYSYAQSLYDFENNEYFYIAYYDDIYLEWYNMSFRNKRFLLDLPELDNEKREEGVLISGRIEGNYRIEKNNGFVYQYCNGKKYLVLYHKSAICVLIDCLNNDTFVGLNKNSKWVTITNPAYRKAYVGIMDDGWPWHYSSYLVETLGGKEVVYNGRGKYYLQITTPWVEDVEGQGIGEWIEKKMGLNIDEIVFFNGYIAPNRPDLYLANSRVKEIKITVKDKDEEESWTFPIENTPNPQIVKLPRLCSGTFRFTINDVYPGTKYTDTCVGGIFFLHPRGQ